MNLLLCFHLLKPKSLLSGVLIVILEYFAVSDYSIKVVIAILLVTYTGLYWLTLERL